MKVYKLNSEFDEIKNERFVYSSYEMAVIGIRDWEGFLGTTPEYALKTGDVWIDEWDFI